MIMFLGVLDIDSVRKCCVGWRLLIWWIIFSLLLFGMWMLSMMMLGLVLMIICIVFFIVVVLLSMLMSLFSFVCMLEWNSWWLLISMIDVMV